MNTPRLLNDSAVVMEDLARVRMELQTVHPHLQSLLISGVSGGEGVTSVAATFALLCARENKRVALVDWNLGGGEVRALYDGMEKRNGATPRPVVIGREVSRKSGADLCALHEKLKSEYDWVLWDCPALGQFSESMELAGLVDGVLLVLAADQTKSDALIFLKERLDSTKATIVGAIINRSGRYLPNHVARRWLERRKRARLLAGSAAPRV